MYAYINTHSTRPDGTKDCFLTIKTECKELLLWWQKQGLNYTATGYGSKIPTSYMVMMNNRWRRVYCRIYSNSGTLYILQGKERFTVSIDNE